MMAATIHCETCNRWFKPLGIMRHRAMHRDRHEDCVITFTRGKRYKYSFSKLKDKDDG